MQRKTDSAVARASYDPAKLHPHRAQCFNHDGIVKCSNAGTRFGATVVPDVFVVFGVPKQPPRDNWLSWQEGKFPDFVLEVTSRHTRRRDEGPKRDLYRQLGVDEYWQYDPTGDYLDPRLKGSSLVDGRYRPIPTTITPDGVRCASRRLGLELRLEGDALRFFDPAHAEYVATPEEDRARADQETSRADRARREAGRARREADAAMRRVAELEAALKVARETG